MAAQTDFWGEIQPTDLLTPVAILRQQAALLGTKTNNLLEAEVHTIARNGQFSHSFNLVAPTLDNYTYELFTIRHGPNVYPVEVPLPFGAEITVGDFILSTKALKSEEEFKDWLRQKLSSADTKKIIGNLLAQASS